MRYVLTLAVAIAAIGVGSALGASQASDGEAAAASDKAVVQQLKALRRDMKGLRSDLKGVRTDIQAESRLTEDVVEALGQFTYQRDTVRGLLSNICEGVRSSPALC